MENASQYYIEPINNTVIEQAFKNYYKVLVQYGFTILKDRDEAEDRVQQVFTILVQKMESIVIETNLKAYLYKAVYHQSLNKLEYQKRRPNMDISLMAENQNMTIETSFHDDLALKIEKEIDVLPAQCSKIFRMSRYQDLKYLQSKVLK